MAQKLDRSFPVHVPITTSAADTLKETLMYHHISQKDFADKLGISQAHVSDVLSRKKFMSDELALKIEQVTGISAEFLLRLDFYWKIEQMNQKRETMPKLEHYDWAAH